MEWDAPFVSPLYSTSSTTPKTQQRCLCPTWPGAEFHLPRPLEVRGPEQTGKVGAGNTQWWLQFALRPWQLSRGPGGSSSCSPGLPAAAPTASGDWASHRQASGDWVKAGLGPRPPSHRDTHNSSSHTSSHGSKALRPYNTRPVKRWPRDPSSCPLSSHPVRVAPGTQKMLHVTKGLLSRCPSRDVSKSGAHGTPPQGHRQQSRYQMFQKLVFRGHRLHL